MKNGIIFCVFLIGLFFACSEETPSLVADQLDQEILLKNHDDPDDCVHLDVLSTGGGTPSGGPAPFGYEDGDFYVEIALSSGANRVDGKVRPDVLYAADYLEGRLELHGEITIQGCSGTVASHRSSPSAIEAFGFVESEGHNSSPSSPPQVIECCSGYDWFDLYQETVRIYFDLPSGCGECDDKDPHTIFANLDLDLQLIQGEGDDEIVTDPSTTGCLPLWPENEFDGHESFDETFTFSLCQGEAGHQDPADPIVAGGDN